MPCRRVECRSLPGTPRSRKPGRPDSSVCRNARLGTHLGEALVESGIESHGRARVLGRWLVVRPDREPDLARKVANPAINRIELVEAVPDVAEFRFQLRGWAERSGSSLATNAEVAEAELKSLLLPTQNRKRLPRLVRVGHIGDSDGLAELHVFLVLGNESHLGRGDGHDPQHHRGLIQFAVDQPQTDCVHGPTQGGLQRATGKLPQGTT